MALTSLLNMKELLPLFTRAQQGDKVAKAEIQKFSPMLSDQVSEPEMQTPGMATMLGGKNAMELPEAKQDARLSEYTKGSSAPTGAQGNFDIQGVDEQRQKHSWLRPAVEALEGGLSGYLNVATHGRYHGGGGIVGKWKEEQLDALKRKHAMWENTFEESQQLPQSVLTDPRLSGLAKAKAALDKDMADGKIDNEKSVSNFLTERARHKDDIAALTQMDKINQQVISEGQLQQGRIKAGLAEDPNEYNFEGTPTSKSQFLQLDTLRQARGNQQNIATQRGSIAERAAKIRADASVATAGINAKSRTDVAKIRGTEHSGNVSRQLMNKALSQIQAAGDITDPAQQRQAATRLVGDYYMQQADNEGLIDETEEGYEFEGQTFPATPEGIDQLHQTLDRFYGAR